MQAGSWLLKPLIWWLALVFVGVCGAGLLGFRYYAGRCVVFAGPRSVDACHGRSRFSASWTNRIPALKAFDDVRFVSVQYEADKILPWLKYQPNLAGLYLYGGECSTQSCRTIATGCPQLEEICIHSANLSVNDCRQLARLSRLRELSILGQIEEGGVDELSHLPHLMRFGYEPRGVRPSHAQLHKLAGMPQVRRLYLHLLDAELETALSPRAGDPPVLPSVSYLHLGPSSFSERSLAKLQALPKLTHLTLSETKVDDAGTRQLASLTNLRQLYLAHCPITDEGCQSLAKLSNLESLHLGGTKITIEGVRQLTVLKNLRQLTIKECYQIRDQSEIGALPKSFLSRCRVVR
jgi:Leucine-rich repeat (LRR) protein